MATASTPSSSPPLRNDSASDDLTPARKVQALLARFDDSDLDASIPDANLHNLQQPSKQAYRAGSPGSLLPAQPSEDVTGDDEEILVSRRGRLAARLDSPTPTDIFLGQPAGGEASRSSTAAIGESFSSSKLSRYQAPVDSSEDELSKPFPTRRLLLKRKRGTRSEDESMNVSPASLLVDSPVVRRQASSGRSSREASVTEVISAGKPPSTDGRQKLFALVEKQRKHRLAMEAAEIAKAARASELHKLSKSMRGERGSSIADSSGDDTAPSDEDAVARLAKDARPTRKASKRALEEMNRETQRMSRNMQLAHQAKTKKKVTKESLLALFDFPTSTVPVNAARPTNSLTSSSPPTSDIEGMNDNVTPPTSPLLVEDTSKNTLTVKDVHVEDLPGVDEILAQPSTTMVKQKGDLFYTLSIQDASTQGAANVRPINVRWTKEDAVAAQGANSDSDLEIVTSHGKTRKYAVFEKRPVHKAHEAESHHVLRHLANLGGHTQNSTRSSMNKAQMEASLRRAARLQAQHERQEKIEELKAKGVVIQTSEEREREQQEVEDLVEKARQEGAEIQRREKQAAKKDGTYKKDTVDDDDDEEDSDFDDEENDVVPSGSEDDPDADISGDENSAEESEEEMREDLESTIEDEPGSLIHDVIELQEAQHDTDIYEHDDQTRGEYSLDNNGKCPPPFTVGHKPRRNRTIVDDDDEQEEEVREDELAEAPNLRTPIIPGPAKVLLSAPHSTRKMIPGLPMSNESPMGLTQAFAATMADSQSYPSTPESQAQDSIAVMRDLPSPNITIMPQLQRLDSIDVVSDSQPATQTQPLDINFDETQQNILSPTVGLGVTGTPFMDSQMPFEPTQDGGYMLSPYAGSRFGVNTPQQQDLRSTIDTIIVSEGSPILQRKGRLRRGQVEHASSDEDVGSASISLQNPSAFAVMQRAATKKKMLADFDREKSKAKEIVDEAAEESEDEYAGLGGASDDDAGEEDEDDRQMIDHDTEVGKGDEAKLAGLFADRERQQDEAAVSKLLKDITTGALRRKRGVGDDLDISDEEDEAARRREAKRREYAKMRRELFKDEAVEKIAEDKKKEAFLKSIEDREEVDDDDAITDEEGTQEDDSQSPQTDGIVVGSTHDSLTNNQASRAGVRRKQPLQALNDSQANRLPPTLRRRVVKTGADKKPATLAEIRDSVSFLIEEPDSHCMTIDLGLSDSEDEPEKYLDLDRHLKAADEDNEEDVEDLDGFIVQDSQTNDTAFKVPDLPTSNRASYAERRTKARVVVDRLSLLRQSSSSSSSSAGSSKAGGKMAFFTAKSSVDMQFGKVPSLLRRATTNSSFGSTAGREESATGVVITKERGHAGEEKAFIRKGSGGQRNAVNYRVKPAESKMSERAGVKKTSGGKVGKKNKGGFLGGLFAGDSWA